MTRPRWPESAPSAVALVHRWSAVIQSRHSKLYREKAMNDIVVGIDLGTSNSVISVVLEGEPLVIPYRCNR